MNEQQAYFLAIFKRHPVRAIRRLMYEREARKSARLFVDAFYAQRGQTFTRLDGETDDEFRRRIHHE